VSDIITAEEAEWLQRKQEWWVWHRANPEVWKLFERFSFEAVGKGFTHFSHWSIMNRIRWETQIVTTGADFKISNDYFAFYARLWNATHPQHRDFFTVKRMRGEPANHRGLSIPGETPQRPEARA
jgi:hypothetical protein